MTRMKAAGTRILALAFLSAAAGAGLARCASIQEALLGGGTKQAAQPPENVQVPPEAAPAPGTPVPPPAAIEAGTAPLPASVTPVPIEAGDDTGTVVGHTVQGLRSQLQNLETKIGGDAARYAELRNAVMQAGTSYHESTAHIVARLGAGTTKDNPELTAQWNSAQSALDALTTNINALSALANEVANDSSTAHYESDTIQATFNVSGAVEEDHHQLSVLANETSQTIVVIDRLMSDVNDAVQRQTAYAAGERGNLTSLASAIKAGKYSTPMLAAPGAAAMPGAMASGEPIVTIKFARAHVSYDRVLYAALSQALAAKPRASFSVVAVAPTGGTTAAVQLAQNNAQAVMRTMTEMGVPATRMGVSSSTDPGISASEVRVYVR